MGAGVYKKGNRWLGRTIPYVVHSSYPAADVPKVIEPALLHWEAKTAFRFVRRTTEVDFIEFRRVGNT